MTPSLAGIIVGDDSVPSNQRLGRPAAAAGAFSSANLARAREIAPGLTDIGIGAF
jgi:hypothetical protein